MIVPSRSIKTAGDGASLIFAVRSTTGDEFISRHSRGSKFAYDYSTRVISNFRRFDRSRAADQPKREERNRGVACTRDIENLASLCADVVRRVVLLKKHHPVFAKCDQDILSLPFLKKRFTGAFEISVFCWSLLGLAPRNPRCKEGFSSVWFDDRNTAPVDGVSRIWIGRYYFTGGGRLAGNLSH